MKNDPKKPRKRSPVPPPGYVMGKTSYDRTAEKEKLERERQEYLRGREMVMKRITIAAGKVVMQAELNDSATARKLTEILPVEASARVWGNEIYFTVPMHAEPENAQAEAPPGTVAFWPDGDCLCVFFGQKPYSPVNVVGKLLGDPSAFAEVRDGDPVRVEAAGEATE